MIMETMSLVHKFLAYLNISNKYLNRTYIGVSTIPIFYIGKNTFTYYEKHNLFMFYLYLFFSLFFIYFLILNILYYFFDKNTKLDITQVLAKYLPDEVFEASETSSNVKFVDLILNKNVTLDEIIEGMNENNLIKVRDEKTPGQSIPYYKVESGRLQTTISISYDNKEYIEISSQLIKGEVVGVLLFGGEFIHEGLTLSEPYSIKIAIKDTSVI